METILKCTRFLFVCVFQKVEWFKKRFEECDRNHDGKLQFDGVLNSIFLNYEKVWSANCVVISLRAVYQSLNFV